MYKHKVNVVSLYFFLILKGRELAIIIKKNSISQYWLLLLAHGLVSKSICKVRVKMLVKEKTGGEMKDDR